MRFLKITLNDISFQMRYGFYFLYAVFTVVYLFLLLVVPISIRGTLATILIFTDPAAMGLFFMGAIILLEKSQRVNCSLAVSPIKIWEYIGAKVLSLATIGTVVGGILTFFASAENFLLAIIGVAFSSILFSLCGLLVTMKIDTLNKFILATIPFEIIIFIPALLYIFGAIKSPWFIIHPGIAAVKLISGGSEYLLLCIASLVLWSAITFWYCKKAVKTSFSEMGGGKL